MLDDPGHDRLAALERQRELIEREIERLGALAAAVDAAIKAHVNGTRLEEATMFEGFDASEHEEEARERWGDTAAYGESARRTAYTCSPEMHRGLGEMYLADERFARVYEREAVGLAAYFRDAIVANAAGEHRPRAPVSR